MSIASPLPDMPPGSNLPRDSSAGSRAGGSGFAVELSGVEKIYGSGDGAVVALHETALAIPHGLRVALIGRSGSGKSTLLNLLGGVDRPTRGRIRIGDSEITALSEQDLVLFRRRRLGYVFQSFHLLPSLTAFENVALPWLLDRKLTAPRRQEIAALLDRLGISPQAHRYPDQLSGGQQQRVALARGIIHRPDLLLADEPTGNLDARTGTQILDLLAELGAEYHTTIVMATHSQEAAERCSAQIRLDDGRVVGTEGLSL